jgi:uncharacterized membrane protein
MKFIQNHPIKISFKTEWFPLSLIFLSLFSSFWFFYLFPSMTPNSWSFTGQINTYLPAWLSAFLLPSITIVIYLVFIFLPSFDPKLKVNEEFIHTYHHLKDIIIVYLLSIYFLRSFFILGYPLDLSLWILLLTACLFFYLAFILPKLPTNWFLGIRTPWTLSSKLVWKKTHLFSKKLFLGAAFLLALSSISPSYIKTFFLFIALFLIIIVPFIYSLLAYRQEKNKKN